MKEDVYVMSNRYLLYPRLPILTELSGKKPNMFQSLKQMILL